MLAHPFWSQPFPPNLLASTAPWCPDNVATTFWSSQLHSQNSGSVEFLREERFSFFLIQKTDSFESLDVWTRTWVSLNSRAWVVRNIRHPFPLFITQVFQVCAPWYPRPLRHGPGAAKSWRFGWWKPSQFWVKNLTRFIRKYIHPIYRFLVDEVDTVWMKGKEKPT